MHTNRVRQLGYVEVNHANIHGNNECQMAIYRYVIFDIPPLCLCCSLLLSITAHWQLAIHLVWPRNVHLSDYSPHPAPKSGQGRGGSCGKWGKLANKVAIGYYNFPVSAFLQSSHKTIATTERGKCSTPPAQPTHATPMELLLPQA